LVFGKKSTCSDRCDGEQSQLSDDESSPVTRRRAAFEMVTPHRLHPNLRRVADEDDGDMSDTDSLAR
jgi:hypothetical protein